MYFTAGNCLLAKVESLICTLEARFLYRWRVLVHLVHTEAFCCTFSAVKKKRMTRKSPSFHIRLPPQSLEGAYSLKELLSVLVEVVGVVFGVGVEVVLSFDSLHRLFHEHRLAGIIGRVIDIIEVSTFGQEETTFLHGDVLIFTLHPGAFVAVVFIIYLGLMLLEEHVGIAEED